MDKTERAYNNNFFPQMKSFLPCLLARMESITFTCPPLSA